jgi:hypothetical protein
MPQDVIDRVHTFARQSNAKRALLFAWRDGTPIADEDDDTGDTEYNPSDKSNSEDDDSYTDECHDYADDEYPPDTLDIPITGVLDENENDIWMKTNTRLKECRKNQNSKSKQTKELQTIQPQ